MPYCLCECHLLVSMISIDILNGKTSVTLSDFHDDDGDD